MTGLEEIQQARQAGFSDQEIEDFITSEKAKAEAAGFSSAEVDEYYGRKQFDDAPVKALLNDNHKQATTPQAGSTTPPKPITNFTEALEAGLQMSVSGLAVRGQAPEFVVTEDTSRANRIAANVASLAGDIPAMVGGFALGGGQITGMAGAFALPTAMRRVLMDKYEKGEVNGWGDFWDRFSGVALDTAKSWITGAATGAAGKAVGGLGIPSKVLKGSAVTAAELGTMVTVGNALEGHVPNADDFVDTAIALGFVKGSAAMAKKLRNIYSETGVTPEQLAKDAEADPTIKQDLGADNMEIPRKYKTALQKVGENISSGEQDVKPSTWQDVYTKFVDDLNPIREEVKKMNKLIGEGKQGDEQDPYTLMRLLRGSVGRSAHFLEQGTTDFKTLKNNGESLRDILKGEQDLDSLRQFLVARRAVELHGRGINPGVDLKTAEAAVAEGGKKFQGIAKRITDYQNRVTQYLRDSGVLSDKAYEAMTEANRAYVPFFRVMDEQAPGLGKGSSVKNPIHAIKGSDRPIVDPLESIIKNTYVYVALAERNAANRSFITHADKTGIPDQFYTKVKQPVQAIEVQEPEIRKMFEAFTTEVKQRSTVQRTEKTTRSTGIRFKTAKGSTYEVFGSTTKRDKAARPEHPGANERGPQPQSEHTFYVTEQEMNALAEIQARHQNERRIVKLSTGEYGIQYIDGKDAGKIEKRTVVKGSSAPAVGLYPVELWQDGRRVHFGNKIIEMVSNGEAKEPDSKAFTHVKNRTLEALKARGFADGEANQMVDRLMAKRGDSGAVETLIREVEKTEYVQELNIRLPHEAATIFRKMQTPLKPNEIAVFENGKRSVYEVDPDVASAFKAMDAETANLFVKLIAVPAQTLRAGAILSPDFMARNALRDQLSAMVLSKHGFFPIFDFVRGAMSLIKKDEHYGNWLKSGGANAAMVSVDRQYLSQHLFNLSKETGLMERAWNVAKSPIEVLRVASELVENSTRLGEFKKATAGTAGTRADLQKAGFASREVTLDFARIGANMRAVNMISAFTNAQIQGLDRVVRGFGENPIGMSAKIGAAITLPSMLLWWANHDDERWKEIPNWQKDLFWIVMTKDHIYRIPKPFELGLIFGTLPERSMEAYFTENPNAFHDFEKSMIDAFTPNLTPQIAQPIIEQFSNRSLFTGMPVIPAGAEKLLPEYQYHEYTTELTKALGHLVGAFPGLRERSISDEQSLLGGVARALSTPALVENYVRSWTGGLGMYAIQLADKALRDAGALPDPVKPTPTLADIPFVKAFVVRYPAASAQSIQDFYSAYSAQKRYIDTVMAKAKEGDPVAEQLVSDYADRMLDLTAMKDALSEHSQLVRLIYKNPDMPADEKRQLIDTLYFRMIELADAGNSVLRDSRKEQEP